MVELGFSQCTTDMCLYVKEIDEDITIVWVYADNLLVIGTSSKAVEQYFTSMLSLEIKDLGVVNKILGL